MNSVQKEMIRLYAKQLRLPTFNNYEKVIRKLSDDDGYEQFMIELMSGSETQDKNCKIPNTENAGCV